MDPGGACTMAAAGVEVSLDNLVAGLKMSWPIYKVCKTHFQQLVQMSLAQQFAQLGPPISLLGWRLCGSSRGWRLCSSLLRCPLASSQQLAVVIVHAVDKLCGGTHC